MQYTYQTKGTCSSQIHFELDGDVIKNVCFTGGCNGNLQGIGRLLEGMNAEQAANKLAGLTCGLRPTSCPDQLAAALRQALSEQAGQNA